MNNSLHKIKLAALGVAADVAAPVFLEMPMFAPNSNGSLRRRGLATMEAANQTIPLLGKLLERQGKAPLDIIPIESLVRTESHRQAASLLKAKFTHYGSDKSKPHDYHLLYGTILDAPETVTAVLEIGLGSNDTNVVSNMGANGRPGASLRAFRDFLPNAQIYGADVDPKILFREERIETLFVDQTRPETFGAIGDIGPDFDLIIDDGLHSPNANLATLLFGLDRLKPRGWLVIEDIAEAAVPVWQIVAALISEHCECSIVAARGAMLFTAQRRISATL